MKSNLLALGVGISALALAACSLPTRSHDGPSDLRLTPQGTRPIDQHETFCVAKSGPDNAGHTVAYLFPQDLSAAADRPKSMFVVIKRGTGGSGQAVPSLRVEDGFRPEDVYATSKPSRCVSIAKTTDDGGRLVVSNDCTNKVSTNRDFRLVQTAGGGETEGPYLLIDIPATRFRTESRQSSGCGLPFDQAARSVGISPYALWQQGFRFKLSEVELGLYWSMLGGKHELKNPEGGEVLADIHIVEGSPYRRRLTGSGESSRVACWDVFEFVNPDRNHKGLPARASLTNCDGTVDAHIELDKDQSGHWPNASQQHLATWTISDRQGNLVATYAPLERLSAETSRQPVYHTYELRNADGLKLAESWDNGWLFRGVMRSMYFHVYWNQYIKTFTREQLALLILGMSYE